MNDIAFLLNSVSLFIGVASISISIFINRNYKNRSLKLFIGLDISLFLIQSAIALNTYMDRIAESGGLINILSMFFDAVGTSFSSLFGLLLINSFLGKEIAKTKKIIILLLTGFQFAAIIICYWTNLIYLEYVVKISVIVVVLSEIFMIIVNYKLIGNKDLRKAFRVFIVITLCFFPLLVFEAIRNYILLFKGMMLLKLLSLPAFFCAINLFFLVFANQYFNTPAFYENNKLTEFFIKKYSITSKETEVIEFLLSGLTYKQIAEKLYISNKTVDNHIQNIYKKLEVTNKIQLFNLIRSKEMK